MIKYEQLKKVCALFLCCCIMCSLPTAGAVCYSASNDENIVLHEDGSYSDAYTLFNGFQVVNEYSASDELLTSSTISNIGDKSIAITDDGENVYKTIYDINTGETQIFTKSSGESDSEYKLYFEVTANTLSEQIEKNSDTISTYSYVVTTYKANCYDYRMYTFNNNGHDLWMGNNLASAAPNNFLSACSKFQSYSEQCDDNTYSLIKDIFGFIPGAGTILTIGDILYSGAIAKDTSKAVGTALYNYALAVASTVCKTASAIALIIDSVSLLNGLRQVQKNWQTVFDGQT